MTRVLRDFRLLPLVLVATVALLALKSFGLLFDGGYILGPPASETQPATTSDPDDAGDVVGSIGTLPKAPPAGPADSEVTAPVVPAARPDPRPPSRQSWAQEMFNFPDVTGSVGGDSKKKPAASAPKGTTIRDERNAPLQGPAAARNMPAQPAGVPPPRNVSPSERAILERLQQRRKDLEAQARELDMRESLLKAAESRLESRIKELKQVGGRVAGAPGKKDEESSERFKGLVAMYENMKAKDAARIFDRLDLKILASLAGQINPRRMADILANMSAEAAERLTVEFASSGAAPNAPSPQDLPKIEGRPNPSP